jgi:ribokinase
MLVHGPAIIVLGSINIDICVGVDTIPRPGETVAGRDAVVSLGGKGANQAVAAARLGTAVSLVGCTGDDAFGHAARQFLSREALDTSLVRTVTSGATGVALITVDATGQNAITVSPGTNALVAADDATRAFAALPNVRMLLLQNEVPMVTAIHAARLMRGKSGIVIVDPAPAGGFDHGLLPLTDIITPNETEAASLTGISVVDHTSALLAAHVLLQQGARAVVLKRGAFGVSYAGLYGEGHVDAPTVRAVDTVAAGDCFNGALAAALCGNVVFAEAVRFACRAAALSVTRSGASSSMPYRHELT